MQVSTHARVSKIKGETFKILCLYKSYHKFSSKTARIEINNKCKKLRLSSNVYRLWYINQNDQATRNLLLFSQLSVLRCN